MKLSKLFICFVCLIFLSFSLFAVEAMGLAGKNVDLSNGFGRYDCLGKHDFFGTDDNWEQLDLGYYSDRVITTIDVTAYAGKTIEFVFSDMNYCYGENGPKRPYSVELVFWQEWNMPIGTEKFIADYKAFGSGHKGDTDEKLLFEIPTPEQNDFAYEVVHTWNYPGMRIVFGIYYYVLFGWTLYPSFEKCVSSILSDSSTKLTAAYIDVVLVLPDYDNEELLYAENNEYKSSFTYNVESFSDTVEFSANYLNINSEVGLSVTIDNLVREINLNENEDTIWSEVGIDIGDYEYHTSEIYEALIKDEGCFYSFLSSSSDPLVSNGDFILTSTSSGASFTYEAGLSSNKNGTVKKWYSGGDTVNVGIKAGNESIVENLVKGTASRTNSGNTYYYSYSDSGDIWIRLLNSGKTKYSIPPGTYTSTIYFHVVANL